jgi:hypothetical protein
MYCSWARVVLDSLAFLLPLFLTSFFELSFSLTTATVVRRTTC